MRVTLALATFLVACQPGPAPRDLAQASPHASPAPIAAPSPLGPFVLFGGRRIPVTLADTPESRRQGLSDRPSLEAGTGLVLSWETPQVAKIWMPRMNFPIDVVFVKDARVLAVYPDRQPCPAEGPCPSFGPDVPVDWVLEVPAGSAAAWGLSRDAEIRLER